MNSLNAEGLTPTYLDPHHSLFESNYVSSSLPIPGYHSRGDENNIRSHVNFMSNDQLTLSIAPI